MNRINKVGIFFATGYEEIEALTVVDLLRREDIDITMISITGNQTVKGSHQIAVEMDCLLEKVDFSQLDMLVLPGGGEGTRGLEACEALMQQVDTFYQAGKYICAICAAPSILGHRGMLNGRRACSYPAFEDQLEGAQVQQMQAVVDGNVITGRGMGCSIPFALAIVEQIKGAEAAKQLAEKIVYTKS